MYKIVLFIYICMYVYIWLEEYTIENTGTFSPLIATSSATLSWKQDPLARTLFSFFIVQPLLLVSHLS